MAASKPTSPCVMSAAEYRAALDRLGFAGEARSNDAGYSHAARFFGATLRTGLAWAADGPPGAVAVTLRLMLALNLSAEKAAALLARRR